MAGRQSTAARPPAPPRFLLQPPPPRPRSRSLRRSPGRGKRRKPRQPLRPTSPPPPHLLRLSSNSVRNCKSSLLSSTPLLKGLVPFAHCWKSRQRHLSSRRTCLEHDSSLATSDQTNEARKLVSPPPPARIELEKRQSDTQNFHLFGYLHPMHAYSEVILIVFNGSYSRESVFRITT